MSLSSAYLDVTLHINNKTWSSAAQPQRKEYLENVNDPSAKKLVNSEVLPHLARNGHGTKCLRRTRNSHSCTLLYLFLLSSA